MSRLHVALHPPSATGAALAEGRSCEVVLSDEDAVSGVVVADVGVVARTKTSSAPFVSSGTSLVGRLSKDTMRPSTERAGNQLPSFAWVPSDATLTRSVTSAPTG